MKYDLYTELRTKFIGETNNSAFSPSIRNFYEQLSKELSLKPGVKFLKKGKSYIFAKEISTEYGKTLIAFAPYNSLLKIFPIENSKQESDFDVSLSVSSKKECLNLELDINVKSKNGGKFLMDHFVYGNPDLINQLCYYDNEAVKYVEEVSGACTLDNLSLHGIVPDIQTSVINDQDKIELFSKISKTPSQYWPEILEEFVQNNKKSKSR